MPIFAYRCQSCGFEKDVLQKRSDPPLADCPACSRDTFARQLTAPAFQLKGSGWYATDFRENGKGKPKPAEAGDGAPAGPATTPAEGAPAEAASEGSRASGGTPAASGAPAASPASTPSGASGTASAAGQAA